MIMPIDFQFLYAVYFLQNEICIYNFGCIPSNFVVYNELFFFRVRHLKMKEKESTTLLFTNLWRHLARIWLAIWSQVVIGISIACRRYLGWVFPLKFSSACGTGTAWKVELSSTLPVPQADCRRYLGQAFPLKKSAWDMSPVVPQALPPVPQVALRLYGNQVSITPWQILCIVYKAALF